MCVCVDAHVLAMRVSGWSWMCACWWFCTCSYMRAGMWGGSIVFYMYKGWAVVYVHVCTVLCTYAGDICVSFWLGCACGRVNQV